MENEGLFSGLKGTARIEAIQEHRLAEFTWIFNEFLDGKASAELVRERGRKLVAIGLPPRLLRVR